ncbi:uncharacterized protein BYT42DRAFT_642263 [Radiomyces spectabilis]|uniref:uncharacterized protein n=1 Tax=Radiomyces spectabilis TaxID=64574 RepID=UPI00221EB2D6|nr:uncharacterized protein BYT42DRAFT_642263 [Radiomyces spectabilis]KAI8387970.1 hypothetical protein BYT42DRAFT_642263 [Radiomyces spectabilis]
MLPANSDSSTSNPSTPNAASSQASKPPQKKKKAARACIHCQKAHLTCDDSRPCQRCIKRDLASTCTDGARKKAKYLQDAEDARQAAYTTPPSAQPTSLSPFGNTATSETPLIDPHSFMNSADNNTNLIDTNRLMGLENYNYGFGSSATNLEYSMLSSMLGSERPFQLDATSTAGPSPAIAASTPPAPTIWSSAQNSTPPAMTGLPDLMNHGEKTTDLTTNSTFPGMKDALLYSSQSVPPIASSTLGTSHMSSSGISTMSPYGDGAVVAKVASPVSSTSGAAVKRRNQIVTPDMAYASAKKPFSYAEGYHYLINYVREKMSQEDLMRISRALALFRPSVLASMMNLTEDDLIFTEKCLQRTLLEYEKLISYSGTPTVVWRRTGEIALVGKEFSLLTQWSRDALLQKKTYIYELMSNPSAVEYWEKYALHAFDNTDSAVYSSCILLSPTKRVVPCTFCFTIKRDIFDLPSVIVGNFLPILS